MQGWLYYVPTKFQSDISHNHADANSHQHLEWILSHEDVSVI